MGYTHYWTINRDSPLWRAAWPRLDHDTRIIMEETDVELCGPDEDGPAIVDENLGIQFNGADDACESFELYLFPIRTDDFVKTGGREYDVVVACVLLRAYKLAQGAIAVRSDGYWAEDWEYARELYHSIWPNEEIACPWAEDIDLNPDDSNRDESVDTSAKVVYYARSVVPSPQRFHSL